MTVEDITPPDSKVPVFLDPSPPVPPDEPTGPTRDERMREAFALRSDPLFIAWQAKIALGESEEAISAAQQAWLDERAAILAEFADPESA